MTKAEFKRLKNKFQINGQKILQDDYTVVETHISYLILLEQHAYKIKKSVRLPFLDFSELTNREHACRQELHLNRRLAPNIYLDVVTVRELDGMIAISTEKGATIDYAVRMKRVDNSTEMDRLLAQKLVDQTQMNKLASMVADFHLKASTVRKVWDLAELTETYNQLADWQSFADDVLNKNFGQIIRSSCQLSDEFLAANLDKLNQRSSQGWVRDVHGDLHSRNIFLSDPPVIFDCIEFDEGLRQIDILNEIAFFLMDLEYFQAYELAAFFLEKYLSYLKNTELAEVHDEELLEYFKMYRAAVRAKVLMISAKETDHSEKQQEYLEQVKRYLNLIESYTNELQ